MTAMVARPAATMDHGPLVGLRWAIKRSFLDYVARAPGGTGSLSDGAVATESREVVFGPDSGQCRMLRPDGITLAFCGAVTFKAYGGVLFVRIGNPVVSISNGGGELTVLDPTEQHGHNRLRLATFDIVDHLIADGFEHWAAGNVRLASEGRELFNEVYQEAELLEPFAIILPSVE